LHAGKISTENGLKMRQVVLDTETTGLDPQQGHRVIEIGCVEIQNRRLTGRHFHQYLNPDREIDEAAIEVHGITSQFLADKPRFGQVEANFLEFVSGAELVIHNAPFDIGFLDHELKLSGSGQGKMANFCAILDSLLLARDKHPGQRNNLDALCKRYGVDNTQRDLHGALLDAEILADVYLLMTSGQSSLSLREEQEEQSVAARRDRKFDPNRPSLRIVAASADELECHEACLNEIDEASDSGSLWRRLNKA
jgi:DNA polymerase-3 subunit epsilon